MGATSNEQGGDWLANDWRTQHEPDLREKVIFAIVERLKICFPEDSENDIKNTAIKFEDTIYDMATDKDDYLWINSRKIHGFHRKYIIVSSDNGANTTPDPAQGQSLPTSLTYTQTPTSQQLPQNNILSNLSPDSSGLPTQVPITVSDYLISQLMNGQDTQQSHLTSPQNKGEEVSTSQQYNMASFQEKAEQNNDIQCLLGTTLGQDVEQPHNIILQQHLQDSTGPSPNPISLESPASNTNQIQTSAQEHPLFTLPPQPVSDRPVDRLIKAIQSSSPEALAESVSEMSSVISMTDMLPYYVNSIGGSRACLAKELSEMTRLRLQQGDTNPSKRFKRSITTMPPDSTSSSASQINKIEPSCALLQEIIEINGRLVETVVNICSEDVSPSEVTSGTIVTCSYVPVALSATFKALYESGHISQIQPLRLLVPENYPCSPILLETVLFDTASVHKYEDLSGRARSKFTVSMKDYSEPMSLKEISKVWDESARATMAEYVERHGGGTFSSKYGRWESVLRAS